MNVALKTSPPMQSCVQSRIADAYFYDAWQVNAAYPELAPLEQYIRVMQDTPKWLDSLMRLRNVLGGIVGLKDLGVFSEIEANKPEASYSIGDRVGIFTLLERHANEVLLGDEDKHLSVVVSVYMEEGGVSSATKVTITTCVHIKNCLGKLYMLPVTPVHYQVARRVTQAVGEV
ncbi:DUF2867 domain-containing protein [Marinomonas sp.]